MKSLNFELLTLCRRNRDGSFVTRNNRKRLLQKIANDLYDLGFRNMQAKSLKEKHVLALTRKWRDEGVSHQSIANYMAFIRWWAEKVGRSRIMRPSNKHYGIAPRQRTATNKAQFFEESTFLLIPDIHIRTSIRLQQAFGLRKEECLKFQPSYADKKTQLDLKGSWTKGGRPRSIPIVEQSQRDLVDQVWDLVGSNSLIPSDITYKLHQKRYEAMIHKFGFKNLHGLRHGYAQRRYRTLAGWEPPILGGPDPRDLNSEQREIDPASALDY